MEVLDPGGNGKVADDLWAVVVIHADGDESIMAMSNGDGSIPFIFSDEDTLLRIIPMVETISKKVGKPFKVKRYRAV